MESHLFETERMYVREMRIDDFDSLFRLFQDKDVMQYYPGLKNAEETEQWILWTIANYRKFGIGLWVLEDKESGSFIGQCGLVPQKIEGEVKIEIGYMLGKEWWGRGLATEAAEACKLYGFSRYKFDHIVSLIDGDNLPSIRVSKKLRMTFQKVVNRSNKALHLYTVYC